MALGLSTGSSGSGDFLPIVTFDARAGRLFRVDRTQGVDGWQSDKKDITMQQPTFMVDFHTIETGWAAFTATGPNFAMAPLGQPLPAKPSPEHKQSFKVRLFSPKHLSGLREFSSSSKAVISALDNLHSDFEAAPEAAAGQLPVVKLANTTPITTKGPQGTTTNYAPVFEIVSWGDRPADWPVGTVPAPRAGARTAAPTPAATPASNHVPPPVKVVVQPEAKALETVGGTTGSGFDSEEMPFGPEFR